MALLETLPAEVENTLRELRVAMPPAAQSSGRNGHAAAYPTPGVVENTIKDTAKEAGEETEKTEDDADDDQENAPIPTAEKPLVFETDINPEGAFHSEWLVVDDANAYVFSRNGGNHARMRHKIALEDIQEAKTDTLVGNGSINVRTADETIALLRFSQANIGEASIVARQLDALVKGEPPKQEKVEETRKHCPNCKRVLPEDSEVCQACLNKRAVMLRLFQFLAPYKKQVVLAIALIFGITLVDLLPPWVAGRIIDTLNMQARAHDTTMRPLLGFVGLFFVARLFNAGFVYGQRRLNPWLGGRITMDIRMALYDKFQQLSLGYYDKRSTGSVMARVTNDAENLWDFLADGIPWLISNVLTLLGIGFVLFRLNWQLALLMLTPGPFIFGLTRWFMPRARKKYHVVWRRISKMYSTLNSTLTGMRVVKAFAQEGREVNNFRNRNTNVFQASYEANAFRATYVPLLALLMSSGSYIIWIVGGHQVLNGVTISGHLMTLGLLTMFNGYLIQFYQPFQNFSQVLDWSTRSLTAAERVFEVLDTEPDIKEAEHPVPLPDMQGAVEFRHVAFTYDKAKRVLDDFTLKVEPGEMIGLVGHSGAGKSTIINLLSRFYEVSEGRILVDGIDIRQINSDDFRGQLGIVLQEPFLFPGTLRDNIAYAKPDASVDEVMRAAKAANCHEFIMKFPDGYDTSVGERGQRLSGGERQRISIARAILHDPRILILDEATASVDTETEQQIQEAISRLTTNRTTFAIAHRLSTLRNASRLVVMKDGKMEELGTHEELMEKDGEYAKLVKIQTEVNQIAAV